jgi:hypothetical protein
MAKATRAKQITFTPHPKVLAHLDTLVAYGLFGRNRADVVNRLVCEGIERRVEPFKLPRQR